MKTIIKKVQSINLPRREEQPYRWYKLWFTIIAVILLSSFSFEFGTWNLGLGTCSAQGVAINTTGNAANAKSLLDVDASGMSPKAGILISRMTLAERNAIAPTATETSLLIYQTDNTPGYYYYDGTTWVRLGSGNGSMVMGAGTLNFVPKWTPEGATIGNSSIFDNGNVGIGTTDPKATLDVNGGVRVGNFTTATRPAATAANKGTLIFDTDLGKPYVSNGTVWKPLDSDFDSDGITDAIDVNDNDANDATAVTSDALSGKTFYSGGQSRTGTIVTQTLNAANQTVNAGYYAATTLSAVDADLAAANIKSGTTIFGVVGTLTESVSGNYTNALITEGIYYTVTNSLPWTPNLVVIHGQATDMLFRQTTPPRLSICDGVSFSQSFDFTGCGGGSGSGNFFCGGDIKIIANGFQILINSGFPGTCGTITSGATWTAYK